MNVPYKKYEHLLKEYNKQKKIKEKYIKAFIIYSNEYKKLLNYLWKISYKKPEH
jgi:hypothetical protein